MPEWTSRDSAALLLVLVLVPVLMGPPYANLGRADAEGNRYYRAYFTADFLWHSALAFELGKFSLPPRNPYLTPRAMNYYWTYFLLPATTAELVPPSPAGFVDLQRYLKANAILSGLLMMGALFLVVRSAVPSAGPAALAVALAVLAASAEGLYAIVDLLRRGAAAHGAERHERRCRDRMVLQRHARRQRPAIALVHAAAHDRRRARPGRLVRRYRRRRGGVDECHRRRRPRPGPGHDDEPAARRLLSRWSTARPSPPTPSVPAAFWNASRARPRGRAVMLAVLVGMDAARSWTAPARRSRSASSTSRRTTRSSTLVLSLGPILVPALAGLRRVPGAASRPVWIAGAGIMLGLFLLYFVRISEASWVGFRAGQILLVSIPILLARTFASMGPRMAALLAAVILAIGLPTTVVDTWNAQDIGNRREGPGFRWTLWTTPDQQQAFAWIRANTPATAIVQMEPMVRGREHWTLIPSFAGRRMAAGLPISLLPLPEYRELSERVRTHLRDGQRR